MAPDHSPSEIADANGSRGCRRAAFLSRVTIGALAAAAGVKYGGDAEASDSATGSPPWKGSKRSKVKRWDLVTIGNLSRNHYWGEGDAKGLRSAICTCTVIQGEGFRLVVDPSLSGADEMAKELDRRAGLKLHDITAAFVTHEHADHWYGLAHFPDAKWFAAPEVAAALNQSGKLPKALIPTTEQLFEAVEVLPTPGHTLSHHSLRFDCRGLSVVTAGDAVATEDFWRERRGYYNCVDFALSAASMEKIARLADLVVPGHDNYFLNVPPAS
jgi:glyoxylase-like metal-dependent hydrolase (beta-lactamase superfamily II)